MNQQQLSRIDSFIDSLGQQNMSDQQEAVLLTAENAVLGGLNDRCKNSGSTACGGTGDNGNDRCTNTGNSCYGGDNTACDNRAPSNSSCNEPAIG